MAKKLRKIICSILIFLILFSSFGGSLISFAEKKVTLEDLNNPEIFLKQQTPVTCTLSSAAMLMRRTAVAAGYDEWREITEINLRETAWSDGLGLLWDYTFYNMTVGHGYYPEETDKKMFMLDLLERYPQGVVVYNIGAGNQEHAVFLCDYNSEEDMFYVADPASNAPEGRIPLTESTIVGETQAEQINNLSAYWYVSTPQITVKDGYFESSGAVSNPYDPAHDVESFESTKSRVYKYFVVSNDSSKGAAVRFYPSGSSSVSKYVTKGDILYVSYVGKNNFGADWYKLSSGSYIFNTNLTPFEEYSSEIIKFQNTEKDCFGTYRAADGVTKVELRLEPSEGNNIVAEIDSKQLLYVVKSGVNSVGASWLKTQEGYYVKASHLSLVSAEKLDNSDFSGSYNLLSGKYSASPVADDEPTPPVQEPKEYQITASALNLRKTPVSGEVLTVIPEGAIVEVTSVVDGWGKTSYDGFEGWISMDYASEVKDTPVFKLESISIDKEGLVTGETVSCEIKVQSELSKMFKYEVYNQNGEVVHSSKSYITKNVYEYETAESGEFYFAVDILSSDGRKISAFSGNFTVHDKLQIDSVDSNIDEYAYVSEEILWDVSVVSTSPSASFTYSLYRNGELLAEAESDKNEFSYKPENSGEYVLKVVLKDFHSSSDPVLSEPVIIYDNLKVDSIDISDTQVQTGQEVTYSVVASGGTGEYQYCFTVFNEGVIIKNGSFVKSPLDSSVFEKDGVYRVFCTVKDSGNMIVSAFSAEIKVQSVKKGDADGDGAVTAKDARLALRHSAGLEKLTDKNLKAADVNGDGKVNAADARLILRNAAKLEIF